jgi:hypothetical protein
VLGFAHGNLCADSPAHARKKAAVTSRNRAVIAALSIAVALSLSACGQGFSPQVNDVRADNASGQAHNVLARAIVLVKGQAAPAAALAGTLINAGDRKDQLQTITLTDTAAGSPTITLTPNLNLDPGQLVNLGVGDSPPITVPDASSIRVGDFVNVVLHFRTAGDIALQVACMDRTYYYSDVLPTTSPSPATQGDTPTKATRKTGTATTAGLRKATRRQHQPAGRVALVTKPADRPSKAAR